MSNNREALTTAIDDQRRTALSLVDQAINDIPQNLVLTPEILRTFLIDRVNTLARSGTKAAAPRYIFDIGECKFILSTSAEVNLGSEAQIKVKEVDVCKIIAWLVTSGASAGILCTTITDCTKKVASAKSYLVKQVQKIDVIIKGKEVKSDTYSANKSDQRRRQADRKAKRLGQSEKGSFDKNRSFDGGEPEELRSPRGIPGR